MARTMSLMILGVLLLGAAPAYSQYHDDRYGGYRNDRSGGYGNDRSGGYRNDRYGGYRDDGYYGQYPDNRDARRGRNGRARMGRNGMGRNGGNVVNRVQRDLSRIASTGRVSGRDGDRFQRAISELSRFDSKWQHEGKFDKGHLDRAIDRMNDLLESDRIGYRELNIIRSGRDALRQFRANGAYASNGGSYGGYRPW